MYPDADDTGILILPCNEFTGDFDIPDSWPECITKCPVPVPNEESGFQAAEGQFLICDSGKSQDFTSMFIT